MYIGEISRRKKVEGRRGGREGGTRWERKWGREERRREQWWVRKKNRTFKDFRDIFWPKPTRHKCIWNIISWLELYIYHPSLLFCFPFLYFKCLGHIVVGNTLSKAWLVHQLHIYLYLLFVLKSQVFISFPDKAVWKVGIVSKVSWCFVVMPPKLMWGLPLFVKNMDDPTPPMTQDTDNLMPMARFQSDQMCSEIHLQSCW